MRKIGCFRKTGQEFNGTITLMQSDIKARILAVKHKASSRAPDYIITKVDSDEFTGELGNAWQKHSTDHNIPYLDVLLDNPSLQSSVNAVLCEGSDGLWYLHWDRIVGGEVMIETLYAQEELKPQLGIRPIANFTNNILRFYPELVVG